MEDLIEDTRRREYEIQSHCNEARTIGMETLYSLSHQGEQLKNIKTGLTTVDATLIDTKQNINRLKGVTQRVVDSVRMKFHRKVFSKILLSSTKKQRLVSTSSPQTRSSSPKLIRHNIPSTMSFPDGPIDATLDDFNNAIQSLKGIALEINDQLTIQAETIKDIQGQINHSTMSIEQQNTEIRKIYS
ncbi:unnamed protein product [Adineta ricciae]|uniref:t-SNARE coiled-coil homology domain-containing protein n=1 Tax=Adineta ricciae TaxID=249248 RepID=A0A815ZN64_ADIRI|nr:unnamed protein product [Adineta ricciae]